MDKKIIMDVAKAKSDLRRDGGSFAAKNESHDFKNAGRLFSDNLMQIYQEETQNEVPSPLSEMLLNENASWKLLISDSWLDFYIS